MKLIKAGNLHKYNFNQADTVWSVKGIAPTILAHLGDEIGHARLILEEKDVQLSNPIGEED